MADPIYFGDGIKLACCPTTLESLYIAASGCCSNYYTAFLGGEQSYSIVYTLPTASGSSGQVLTTDDNGNLSWQNNSGGGGTGSPAGSDGYIQYNNGGSFGGASIVYWNDISRRLGIGTSSPNQTLEVAGTMRLTGSTGTSSSILGRSSVGDISSIAIGSGLSLSGNTLISSGGLPASGLTGQILAKNSGSNYDVSWVDNITAVQHMQQYIKNNQGATVSKGQAVYIDGADGTNATIKLAQANSEATSSKTLGLLEQNLAINVKGYVVTEGLLSGIDTSGANAEGDPVWLDPNNAGGLIFGLTNKPVAPAHLVYLGVVIRKNNVNGEIYVKVQNGYELQELHNVLIPSSVTNNDVLAYETSTSLWKNKSFTSLGLVSGTGTTNYIPKWNNGTSLADSVIFQSGTSVGIGTTTLSSDCLDIQGTTASQGGQIGAELMTTGSGTNWTGTSFALGYTHTTGSTFALTSTVSVASSAYYQVSYTITGRTAGTINVSVGGVTSGAVSVSGSLVQSITSATAVTVTPTTDFDGAIILSVKQITASTMATFALKNSSGTVVYEQRAAASNTNIFQGVGAGSFNTLGLYNTNIGFQAGHFNTQGGNNVNIGYLAGQKNSTGSYNSFFGVKSGNNNHSGLGNSFFGFECGLGWTVGSYNSLFGISSMAGTNTGSENAAIGYLSGRYISNGTTSNSNCSNSVFIGSLTKSFASGQSNQTVIGYNAIGLGSNTTAIGNSVTTRAKIWGSFENQSSSTSNANTSLLIQNSATTSLLTIKDDGATQIGVQGNSNYPSINTGSVYGGVFINAISQATIRISGADSLKIDGVGAATFSAQTGAATSGTTNFVTLNHAIAAASAGNASFRPLNIGYTINNTGAQSGNTTGILLNATETALSGMAHELMDLQVTGTTRFKVTNNGTLSVSPLGASTIELRGDTTLTDYSGFYIAGQYRLLSKFNSVLFLNITNSLSFSNGLAAKSTMGTDGQLGLGLNSANSISAKLQVRGVGSTSATTSLLIQNNALTSLLTIKDDGAATFSAQTGTTTSGTNNFVTLDHSIASSGAGNANFRPLNIAYTINNVGEQSGNTTGILLKATETALGGMVHNLIDLQAGSSPTSKFRVTSTAASVSFTSNGMSIGNAVSAVEFNIPSKLYITSPSNGVATISNGNISDFFRLQLGGTSSSFPALAKSSTSVIVTLADATAGASLGVGMASATGVVASAVLQADSTTKGFLPPRMSSSNRDAISPIDGLEIYNNSINAKQVYSTGVTNEWKTVDTALQSLVATGGTLNILFKNGNVANVALNASTIFTFSNAAAGVYIINLKQGVGGSFTVTWPTIKWAGGIPPTLTTTADKYDIITLIYDGINYYGTASLNF